MDGYTIFLNGKFIKEGAGQLSVFSRGFLSGFGLFETMRYYKKRIVYFDAHLSRLKKSARLLGIKYPYGRYNLRAAVDEAIRVNRFSDARVRITLWKRGQGTDILVTAGRYHPYNRQKYDKGFRACVSPFRQSSGPFLSRLKSTNRILYTLAYEDSRRKGFDDAVILNEKGCIAESSRSNIFFIKERELFTPSPACGCLEGITRKAVFDLAKEYNARVYEGEYSLSDLYACDEAFLTGSLMGIMPLSSVGNFSLGAKKRSGLTRFFMKKYNLLPGDGIR